VSNKYKPCPFCTKKGWRKGDDGVHNCRYCRRTDAIQVASKRLHRTLERGHKSVDRVIDKGRTK